MKIYVVMIDGPFAEAEAYVFSDWSESIDFAHEQARRLAGDGPVKVADPAPDGWAYSARYSEDGYVWVVPRILDEPGAAA